MTDEEMTAAACYALYAALGRRGLRSAVMAEMPPADRENWEAAAAAHRERMADL